MISVICPVYNEEKYIVKCIESIINQDYPKDDLEVIFVDGMSTDETRNLISDYAIQYHYIKIIDNPKRIVPAAMNIGIKASSGNIIIRLDAHAEFSKNYFSELARNLKLLHADNVGGVCRTLPSNSSSTCVAIANVLSSSFGMGNSYFRIGAKEVMMVDTVPFGCFNRYIFEKIGYFDEELIRNQDDEFNGRIIKNGGKIYLLPHLIINYYARDSIRKVYRMFNQYGLFKPLVNRKLGSPATLRQFFPLAFVIGLLFGPILLIASLLSGGILKDIVSYLLFIYFLVITCYFLLGLSFALKDTKNVKCILIQSWIYFVVHFGYGWGYLCGLCKLLIGKSFHATVNR